MKFTRNKVLGGAAIVGLAVSLSLGVAAPASAGTVLTTMKFTTKSECDQVRNRFIQYGYDRVSTSCWSTLAYGGMTHYVFTYYK
ncbi:MULTISPECIES: hypothetical protein [Leifsonia]|uniref:hypothetical protein n=1 Tax=Leifsonia TaxID=110932 RepID=UPI001AA1A367|nr:MULTISPECIES: hypothetical protein [Leifsonia]MBO1738782.1 hypothetical protein [Leifsonia sp. TF02-11]MCI0159225.1 hypothetical protein [Leifsonia shinshuensis]